MSRDILLRMGHNANSGFPALLVEFIFRWKNLTQEGTCLDNMLLDACSSIAISAAYP